MARPEGANAAVTRARILEAASQLFAEQGKDGTSMRLVAQRSGVTQATVHHYFGHKADLYEAVISSVYDSARDLRTELDELLAQETDLAALTNRAVCVAYRFVLSHQAVARLALRHLLDHGQLPADHGRNTMVPFLDNTSAAMAAVTGRATEDVRMALLSISFVVVRYGLMTPQEMALLLTGTDTRRKTLDPALIEQVEDHLAKLVRQLLML